MVKTANTNNGHESYFGVSRNSVASLARSSSGNMDMKCFIKIIFLALTLILTQGCGQEETSNSEGTASSIDGYNYTAEGINEFYVNGAWGGDLGIGSGYGKTCCVMLPDKWVPGLSATVEWRRTDCRGDRKERCPARIEDLDKWPMLTIKKDISIEPYERPNSVQVMFLPNDEIKIYISHLAPHHPEHPGKLGRPHPIGHPEWRG